MATMSIPKDQRSVDAKYPGALVAMDLLILSRCKQIEYPVL